MKSKKKTIFKKALEGKKEVKESSLTKIEVDFEELAEAWSGDEEDPFFIPKEENDHLITAQIWIPMPEKFQSVTTKRGLPCGHLVHVAGDSDSGKTTFAIESIISTQKAGGIALYGLTERKFDMGRAIDMGMNRDHLLIYKPASLEKLFELGKLKIAAIRKKHSNVPLLWIWDSISATPSDYELGDKANHNMKAANAISGELRRNRHFIDVHNICFMMINRIYQKQTNTSFEKQTTTYGGKAPKGFSSIQLEFIRLKTIKLVKTYKGIKKYFPVGVLSKIENQKNHLSAPFLDVEVRIDKMGFVEGRDIFIDENPINDWKKEVDKKVVEKKAKKDREIEEKEDEKSEADDE